MSYTPYTWQSGDTVTAARLNNIEQGVANAGGILIVTASGSPLTLDKTWNEINSALLPLLVYTTTNEGTQKLFMPPISTFCSDGGEPYYSVTFNNGVFECTSPTDYPVLTD